MLSASLNKKFHSFILGLYIYLFIYLFISALNVMKSEHVDFLFNVNFDFIFFVSLLV